jgi:eukaryotic-like serine/threonine-protein kinase
VFDWGRDEAALFLVMPYIKRGTLNDMLRQGTILTPYQGWRLAHQIADALDYAHARGVIHRDVKPHNIVAVNEQTFALTDFGLVKLLNDSMHLTQSGSVLGSPSYMSPEQARCRGIDQRSDVYALGIVLYESLVGRLPYCAPSAMEMIGQHVMARPLLPSEISSSFPASIEAVLLRSLCKDPDARYQSAGDFARALGTALADLPDSVQNRPLVTRDQVMGSSDLINEPITIVLKQEKPKPGIGARLKRLGTALSGAMGS